MATTIGQILLGNLFPVHPVYGARRDVKVLAVSPTTGRWTLGEITCRDCPATREIHPGDHFQVTQCASCKDAERKLAKAATREASPLASRSREEAKAARTAANEAKRKERAAKAAGKAQERLAKQQAKLQVQAEKLALIQKVAAEKGVQVSPKASQPVAQVA
jgi:hypothetical protein